MMPEDIDYKAVAESLQRELEQTRMIILGMRNRTALNFSPENARRFIERNYLTIVVSIMLLSFVISSLGALRDFLKKE
jgi:hypothetical protein